LNKIKPANQDLLCEKGLAELLQGHMEHNKTPLEQT